MTDRGHNEDYRREWAIEVLKFLVQRRTHLNEVMKVTKELSESLDRNDRVSVNMLLTMRAEELEKVDLTLRGLQEFKEQLGVKTAGDIDALLNGQQIENQMPEMDKIIDTAKDCRKVLDDIIAVDKRMSRRVAGENSFYEK